MFQERFGGSQERSGHRGKWRKIVSLAENAPQGLLPIRP
jgi:hypothetical protein